MDDIKTDFENRQFEMGLQTENSIISAKKKLIECYNQIVGILKEYLDMPEDYYKFIAIWIIGTYFHESFEAYPYLFFNAMRGSGKTRALKLISALSSKSDGSIQNNMTEAVLFRIPRGVTTCIDEIEQIGSKEKQTLREILNSAYKKGMKIKRMKKTFSKEGENQVVDTFEPYFPICMANIWGMDEVLGDRSITLILEKSNNPAITKKIENFDKRKDIIDIKRTLRQIYDVYDMTLRKKDYIEQWNLWIDTKYNNVITSYTTLTTITTLTSLDQKLTREEVEKFNGVMELEHFFIELDRLNITGRNFELLLPILIVAKEIDEKVLEEMMQIGKKLIEIKREDEYSDSKDVSLFEFLVSKQNIGLEEIPVKELTRAFREFLGDTEDNEDKWLNEKWMGRALKRLNLILNKKKTMTGRVVVINFAKAQEKLKIFKSEVKND